MCRRTLSVDGSPFRNTSLDTVQTKQMADRASARTRCVKSTAPHHIFAISCTPWRRHVVRLTCINRYHLVAPRCPHRPAGIAR
jgi:hypothetical protein